MLAVLLTSTATVVIIHIFCCTMFNLTGIFEKALVAVRIAGDFKFLLYDDQTDLIISLKTWNSFRSYVMKEVLPVFYELTNPIISLLVIAVLCFTFAWIHQMLFIYGGKPVPFFRSIISDNVRLIAFTFTVFLVICTMAVLQWVLRPYSAQSEHIGIIQDRKTDILFLWKTKGVKTIEKFAKKYDGYHSDEESDMNQKQRNKSVMGDYGKLTSNKLKEHQSYIELSDYLLKNMSELTFAPKVMGIQLTRAKLDALRGYLFTVLVLFVGTALGDYVHDYEGLAD